MYKCQDKDCGKTVEDNRRLVFTFTSLVDGKPYDVFKCPYCRGTLKKIKKTKRG